MTLIAYFLRFAWRAARANAYIAFTESNDSVPTLSQNGTERKMVVDTANAAKRGTAVNPLDEEFAHLDALNPHILAFTEMR